MADLLQTLAAYVPPHIARTVLHETSPAPPTQAKADRFPAAVLFADISGFTPLTEALAQRGLEGPEELTRLLNSYFGRMVALVEAEGGEVVKFSGDALLAVFSALHEGLDIATRRATQAAEAMQAAMAEFSALETSAGPVALGMKIGIGAGEVLAVHVGGVSGRWEYVVAGDPVRQMAQAEHGAGRGEIVLSPEAKAACAPSPVPPRPLSLLDWNRVRDPAAAEAVLRAYVPGVVIAWLEEELRAWLAVLRPMSVLFVSVVGIDYAAIPQSAAVDKLHAFLRTAQTLIERYQGSINKLAVDDKGTVLLALFGAPPRAHEDDPERALRCAMDLQTLAEAHAVQLSVGVTTGRVFAGPVGSETRHEYTVMGDTVNLAARLMGIAERGQVLCDYETYRSARARLDFELLSPVRIKGKAGLVRIYAPTGEAVRDRQERATGALVGRQAEIARLQAGLDRVASGQSRILLIEGEAGIGKSRLVEELKQLMQERGMAGLLGMGRSIEQQTPYRAWRDVFTSYFDLEEADNLAERQRRVVDHVHDVAPDMVDRIPLLNDVLSLSLPETELTASLDTQLRHESLVSLLLALLRTWADERPLVLVIEDAHWLDSLSWDLTVQVGRALTVARMPLLLVVVTRPATEEFARIDPQVLVDIEGTERLVLASLTPDEILALTAARLGIANAELPQAVAELVRARAGGNPFFAEELVYTLRDNGLIAVTTEGDTTHCAISGDLDRTVQTLPDTIQGIVLSRIDRLPPEEQLTLKVASVIGRTFAYLALHDTLGEHVEVSHRLLRDHLDDLAQLDLTPLEAPEPELTYIFKHIITQEVAYTTLLFSQRRQLHRTVARWYERHFEDDPSQLQVGPDSPLAPYLPLLAHHWHQAEDADRERVYAGLAGKWAAAQFANVEAAGYLSRALALTPETDLAARYDLLLAREAVNDLRGEREAQAEDLSALIALVGAVEDPQQAARRKAAVLLRQANYCERTSDYASALEAVQTAIGLLVQVQDPENETAGYIAWGTVLWRQGNYQQALAPLKRALELARENHNRQAEARSLYYLGDVHLYQGIYPEAQQCYQQSLEIHRADGNRPGEADCLSNLGVICGELSDCPAARDYFEQALTIHQTIGDRHGQTLQLSNLGVIYCDLGDYPAARDYHEQALDIRKTIGDHWGEAVSLVNLGLVYHYLDENQTARKHCEQALAIQREIGDRRGQGYSLTYLGHALAALDDPQAAGEAYAEAMHLRHELGQRGPAIDDLAGLARADITLGDPEHALKWVQAILSWIEDNGAEGIEYPLQVYLTCYRILQEAADPDPVAIERADALLSLAHKSLMERAAAIGDETLRHKLLTNVKTHREILSLWETSRLDSCL